MLPNLHFTEPEIRAEPASKTYRMVNEEKKLYGMVDQLEAVKQAVYLILNIERYHYLIYSWNYGIEFNDLFGKDIDYACPEIKRRITEALLQDERIEQVDGFSFEKSSGEIWVTFNVHTTFGDFLTRKEVRI